MVLRFREDLDVPRVGVFSHGIPNFYRFFGFYITCSAVILPFDYNMLKEISNQFHGRMFRVSNGHVTRP